MIAYRVVSIFTAFLALALCLLLLLAPEVIFVLFDIQGHYSGSFLGRRTAMLFLGISILTWASRNASHSVSRQAICLGLAVAMMMLALLGLVEFFRGYAGIGISLAILTELVLSIVYFRIWFSHKNA